MFLGSSATLTKQGHLAMIAAPSFACLEATNGLKTAAFTALGTGQLWQQCVATDVGTNMLVQPAASRACTELLFTFMAPVFAIDAHVDAAAFMALYLAAFEKIVRKRCGARVASSIACPMCVRRKTYEVVVQTCVIATFQYGVALPGPTHVQTLYLLDDTARVTVKVRLLPYAQWQELASCSLAECQLPSGVGRLFVAAFTDAASVYALSPPPAPLPIEAFAPQLSPEPLSLCTRVSQVSLAGCKVKSKEVVRLNAAVAKLKDKQAQLEAVIAKLTARAAEDAVVSTPPSPAAPSSPASPLPPALSSPALIAPTSSPPASLSPALIAPASSTPASSTPASPLAPPVLETAPIAALRLKTIARATRSVQRHLRAEPKVSPQDGRPVAAGAPSRACLLKYLAEHGGSILGSAQDMFHRFATMVASLEDIRHLFMGDAESVARPKGLPGLKRVADPADGLFNAVFRLLLSGDDTAPAGVDIPLATLREIGCTRQLIMPVLGMMATLRDKLPEGATQTEALRFTYYAAMTSGISCFARWLRNKPGGPDLTELAIDFHVQQAAGLSSSALSFSMAANLCMQAVVEGTERQGVRVLREAFAHVLPPKAGAEYCYAMQAITAALPSLLTYVNELVALLAWVEETATAEVAAPPAAYTGTTGNTIPPALRAIWQSVRKK
jgi:hypothetical protein